ncbi:MAG TPA: AAA family ATPase [Xanthobacteraceae bacterium]
MPVRITIAGDIGSGKSTIAKRLAELSRVEPLSTGGIQRQLAQARGLSVLELNKLAEQDPSIDTEIDGYLMALPPGDLVVESRMAWHFVPDTLKVYLYISDRAAARRILDAQRSDEDYRFHSDPTRPILARRESEIIRFKKYYSVDIDDLRNYDVVIDTTFASVDDIVKRITHFDAADNKPLCFIDPRNLVPTLAMDASARQQIRNLEEAMQKHGFESASSIRTLYVDHVFYIVDGHARAAAALRAGTQFVSAVIAASNDEPCTHGLSARAYVSEKVHHLLISDWEATVGFRYADEIWRGRAGSHAAAQSRVAGQAAR